MRLCQEASTQVLGLVLRHASQRMAPLLPARDVRAVPVRFDGHHQVASRAEDVISPQSAPEPDADVTRLAGIAAGQLLELLAGVSVGSSFSVPASSSLSMHDTLEYLVPAVLSQVYREWSFESLDGFYFSSTQKVAAGSASLVGLCILISDQRLTPVALDVSLGDAQTIEKLRIRLGERGSGPLGISGPECYSDEASWLQITFGSRADTVEWVYDVVAGPLG